MQITRWREKNLTTTTTTNTSHGFVRCIGTWHNVVVILTVEGGGEEAKRENGRVCKKIYDGRGQEFVIDLIFDRGPTVSTPVRIA